MSSVWKAVLILKFTKSFPPEVMSRESSCFVFVTKSDTSDAYCTILILGRTCLGVVNIVVLDWNTLAIDDHVASDAFLGEQALKGLFDLSLLHHGGYIPFKPYLNL